VAATTTAPSTTLPPTTTAPPTTTTSAPRPTTVPPTTASPPAAAQGPAVPAGSPYFSFAVTMVQGGSGTGYSAYVNAHDAAGNAISFGIQSDATAPQSQGRPHFIWERVQHGQFTYGYLGPAPAGSSAVRLAWWQGPQVAVLYVGGAPVADVSMALVPRLFFNIEGDARQNGDSVNDTFTDAEIAVGNQCPTYCGLNGAWNTSSFNTDGLAARDTNGAPQNGANFTVSGTASAPAGANWDNSIIAGIAMIAQYWAGQ
jgi:hypothetical protein